MPSPLTPSGSQSPLEKSRGDMQYQLFLARVERVDYEAKTLAIKQEGSGQVYENVGAFPAVESSYESTEVAMPEVGALGVCGHLFSATGDLRPAVLTWLVSDSHVAHMAVAQRPIATLEGWRVRRRGVYRKAYPGQSTTVKRRGYTSRTDDGWDHSAGDESREQMDPLRRQHTFSTGRELHYTDAGFIQRGQVNRPGADHIKKLMLPDGTEQQILYLEDEDTQKETRDRYINGLKDIIPISEVLERVQEFSLDFPLPHEVFETDYIDKLLGTKEDRWKRTTLVTQDEGVMRDDQAFLADQKVDHPEDEAKKGLGPTKKEGITPKRRGFIIERAMGTLVGYNLFDKGTYGKVLKPVLFPHKAEGRFGTDVESGYLPVKKLGEDHSETRLAASAFMMRFPHEYNTTRAEITKEGLVLLELGCTIPKENIPWDESKYEHPHGAGRSLEAHLVGSAKIVLGKNRDEEESLDLNTLGQIVMRIGADDASLPQDGRSVMTQIRDKSDAIDKRDLQYWKKAKLKPGDCGDLEKKTGAENVSVRAAFDGGTFIRLGARNPKARRRHLKNGYADGPGKNQGGPNSRTKGRPTYGPGDSTYRFHDLTKVGSPVSNEPPYDWSGAPIKDVDAHGLSLDLHACEDILLRVGANKASGQSVLLDLGGGLVAAIGVDNYGRSITAALDGGAEITIGSAKNEKGLQLEIRGDVRISAVGNMEFHATGDIVLNANGDVISTAITGSQIRKAGVSIHDGCATVHTTEAMQIVHNEGVDES